MPKRRLPPNTDWPGRGVAPRPTRGRKMKGGDWSINDARQSVGPIGRQQVAGLFGARVAQTILARDQCDRTQQAGHMDASDPIKPENSCATGAVHIWVPAFAGTTQNSLKRSHAARIPAGTGGEWPRARGLLPLDRTRAVADLLGRRPRQSPP